MKTMMFSHLVLLGDQIHALEVGASSMPKHILDLSNLISFGFYKHISAESEKGFCVGNGVLGVGASSMPKHVLDLSNLISLGFFKIFLQKVRQVFFVGNGAVT